MANNVYTVFSIESTKKSIEKLTNLLHSKEIEEADWQKKSDLLTNSLYSLLYKDYPKEDYPTREWMTENIGAKWCFVHDWYYGEDYIDLTFESAWNTPEDLFHTFAEYITNTSDDTFSMELRSEDEAYLHIAGGFASNIGSEVIIEDDYEIPHPNSEDPKYKDKDELYDEDLEKFYDHVNDVKDNLIEECRNILTEEIDAEENTKDKLEPSV